MKTCIFSIPREVFLFLFLFCAFSEKTAYGDSCIPKNAGMEKESLNYKPIIREDKRAAT